MSDKDTISYNPEEYGYEPVSSVRITSILFLFIFLGGIFYNIYSFLINDWCWDWRIITLLGFDSFILIFFFAIFHIAIKQNNLPALDGIYPANDSSPEAFAYYKELQAQGCGFSGTIVLKHKSCVNYLEVYISQDKSWLFLRSMAKTLDSKNLAYFAGSIFYPHSFMMVKNETSPASTLPSLKENFTAVLPASSPNDVVELHNKLVDKAKENQLEPIQLNLEKVAETLINNIRADLDYQCKLGLMSQVSYDHYRATILGCIYAAFRAWFFMAFEMGHLSNRKWVKRFQKQFKLII